MGAELVATLLVVMLLAASEPAKPTWTCALVRLYAAKYSESYLTELARSAGISESEIARAKRCLRSPTGESR